MRNYMRGRLATKTRWMLIAITVLGLVACAIPLYRTRAAAPSSGTLPPTVMASVSWDGTAPGGSAPDESACTEGVNCDTYTLTLSGTPSSWTGKKVLIKLTWLSPSDDYDMYVHKNSNTGPLVDQSASGPTTSEEVIIDPTVHGTGVYTVHVVYFAATAADQYHGEAEVIGAVVTPTPPPATQGSGVVPRYQSLTPTDAQLRTGLGTNAGEPTIGSNWKTGRAMFQSLLTTFRVTFNDSCPSTPTAIWEDKSAPTSADSLDPILVTLNRTGTAPNRTIVSQLSGTTSLSSFTDDDGDTWVPNEGGSLASGVDHQALGGGPYHPPVPSLAYPNAVYYCSQDVAAANCARSDDGGLTYGPPVPIYNVNECAGLHGHPKVSPKDGTVYIPNSNCISDGLLSYTRQAVVVSEDNGLTWAIRPIPNSLPGQSDPSVEIGAGGKIYFGYANDDKQAAVAVSSDHGLTWPTQTIQDVGASLGVHRTAFPAVVAGDNNRAAMAFFGSKSMDNPNDLLFKGFWHLYIAHTYDGGLTWITVDATPNDPMQRGGIWLGGGSPINRNLLDFFDATIDRTGRILVGYDDGCFGGPCVVAPDDAEGNSYTQIATIARQTGGRRLFARFDPSNVSQPTVPGAPALSVNRDGAIVRLAWSESDNGGSPITGYKLLRGTSSGHETLLKNLPAHVTEYEDRTAFFPGVTYYYRVVAVNALGESCGNNEEVAQFLGTSCSGLMVTVDPTGDQKGAPANRDLDVQYVAASEADPGKLTFTLKVADLSTLRPNRQWRVLWFYPVGPGGAADTNFAGRYYAGMNTDSAGHVSFEYGIVTNINASPASTQTPETLGPAEPGSFFNPNGTITIVLDTNKIGHPGQGDLIGTIIGRTFAGSGNTTVRSQSAADTTLPFSLPSFATYLLQGGTCVDLVPVKSSDRGTVRVGENLTYFVDVQNRGRATATGVMLTDDLPSKVSFVSATATRGSCTHAGGVVTCNLGTILKKTSVKVTIVTRAQSPGVIINKATATSAEGDRNPSNNTDTLTNRIIP